MSYVTTPGFLDKLVLEDLGGHEWLVDEPFRFYSAQRHRTFKVPRGTVTDLASIPVWVQVIGAILGLCIPYRSSLFAKSGKYNRSAVLHDAAYRNRLVDLHGIELRLHKWAADELFLEAMLVDGVPRREAKAMYWAVRLFGRPQSDR